MGSTDFHVDFESDTPEFSDEYKQAAEMRLRNIANPYNDIHHAMVAVTKTEEGEQPAQFQARVIVDTQPESITITEKDYTVVEALDEALGEMERLVRERYQSSNESGTHNDLPGSVV